MLTVNNRYLTVRNIFTAVLNENSEQLSINASKANAADDAANQLFVVGANVTRYNVPPSVLGHIEQMSK